MEQGGRASPARRILHSPQPATGQLWKTGAECALQSPKSLSTKAEMVVILQILACTRAFRASHHGTLPLLPALLLFFAEAEGNMQGRMRGLRPASRLGQEFTVQDGKK